MNQHTIKENPHNTTGQTAATTQADKPHGDRKSSSSHAYDVAVIGGGAAGLSAAVTLGRFGQTVVVIDNTTSRNAVAGHVHNLLTRDGTPPAELYRLGQIEVERYGGQLVTGTVSSIHGSAGAFTLTLDDRSISASRIVVATGGKDELPDVPGLGARWGKDVLHCAFCHGYEVRGQRIGVLATGPMAIHQAMMFRLLTPHVTVLTHTAPPTADQYKDLVERGIAVLPATVVEVLSHDDDLTGVRLNDDSHIDLDVLVIATTVHARADFLAPLGLFPTDLTINDHVVATRIETGPNGATSVPGIWTAGNTSEPMAQVINAAASGLAAASAIIGEIVLGNPINR
ncbi:thioredoxin reductase [Arthrobacter sp. CAN_A214]|uniref:NAD(P)/FAD-dependent oxidoreductase n=1 Tax=Arthrobacter sp. CAN_A214 TaxID=2787720 RepID=UPI0018C90FF8